MTIDARATAWHHLFPSGTAFTTTSAPTALREAMALLGNGDRDPVLVSWNQRSVDLPDLGRYHGLVSINSRNLSHQYLRDAGFRWIRRFAVLPSIEDARWFIPLGSPRAAAAAVALNRPNRASSYVKYLGVQAAARGGITPVFRDQVIVAQRSAHPLEQALAATLGTSTFELSIFTGTPGPARKPTIAVLSPDGEMLAFVKLATSEMSRRLIENESSNLRTLRSYPSMAPVIPEVAFAMEIDGVFALGQRPLAGAMPRRLELTDQHRVFLETLGQGPLTLATETHFMKALGSEIDGIQQRYPNVAKAFECARQMLEGVEIRQTVTHGDLAPWNVRLQDGRIGAFDWEYGDIDGLPLIDEMHYCWQPALRLQRWTEDQVFEYFLNFRSIQHTAQYERDVVRALQLLSVLHVLTRKITQGHPDTTRFFGVLSNLSQRLEDLAMSEAATPRLVEARR